MNSHKRFLCHAMIVFVMALLIPVIQPGLASAGQNDILLGFRYMDPAKNGAIGLAELPADMSQVDDTNFGTYFTTDTLTIGGNNGDIQIGAIWTAECDPMTDMHGCWREMRIAIDSNGDGLLEPLIWSDPSHPWNLDFSQPGTTWSYDELPGYPGTKHDNGAEGAGTTNDGIIGNGEGESFPHDEFQWWYYESQYDFTQQWHMENRALMLAMWSGRDSQWNVLPNGTYSVNGAVDETPDGEFGATEANKTLSLKIETAYITGAVTDDSTPPNPIQGAKVDAGSNVA